MSEERLAVKSADRVLDVLELLAGNDMHMAHAEIAAALDIPKSSLSQLLATLQARDYLAFSHEHRTWRLGDRLRRFGKIGAGEPDLATLALPVLQRLTEASQESSALNRLEADESVVGATVMGPMRLVSHMRQGDRAPLYATSGGKALLAFMPAERRDAYLAQVRMLRITPRTLASVTALRRALPAVRRDGIATSLEEFTPGIVGMAVPVMRPGGVPLGAINVAMPAVRFHAAASARIGGLLREAAVELLQLVDG